MKNGKEKSTKVMKALVLKCPGDLIKEIDEVRAVKEGLVSRSEFIREAVRCLTRLPSERLWWLHEHALKDEVRLPRLIREAVELLVSQKASKDGRPAQSSKTQARKS